MISEVHASCLPFQRGHHRFFKSRPSAVRLIRKKSIEYVRCSQ